MTAIEPIKILVIEDDADYALVVQNRLKSDLNSRFEPVLASTLNEGLDQLARQSINLVLLDINLPDSRGLDTFNQVKSRFPLVPIVILSAMDDETIALEALKSGAQDYIIKGQVNGKFLTRILNYNLERSRLQLELQRLSLVDSLTGLYNRRGFLALASQHIKLAARSQRGFGVFSIDVDGLKIVNDRDGHAAGDLLLRTVSGILTSVFRTSDIVARLGGDEFVVMAMDLQKTHLELLEGRLNDRLKTHNLNCPTKDKVSFSAGAVYYDPAEPASLDFLIERADKAMYLKKHASYQQRSKITN